LTTAAATVRPRPVTMPRELGKIPRMAKAGNSMTASLTMKKHPSISETLDWTRALVLLNVDSLEHDLVSETLSVILKYEGDIRKAQQELKDFRELQRAKQKQQAPAPGAITDKKDVLH